jgi:SAM-dependent methyltransferase
MIFIETTTDYSTITETPGLKATREQLARLYQRYHFAAQFAQDMDVLEVACGSGIGLGYLAKVARKVVGVDIDEKNLRVARKHYEAADGKPELTRNDKIDLKLMDAHNLSLAAGSFDLVLLYEAIYYLKDPGQFISEANKVLRDEGKLIICSVNPDWDDFHPSPYTYKYYSVPRLYEMLKNTFGEVHVYGGFHVEIGGIKHQVLSLLKRGAVRFNLIPGSLGARAYLKRIFLGKLQPLPAEVYGDMVTYEPPISISADVANKDYKIIYAVARKIK